MGTLTIRKSSVSFRATNFFGISRKVTTYLYPLITKVEEGEENANVLRLFYIKEKKKVRKYKTVEFVMKNITDLHRSIQSMTPYINQSKRRSSSMKRRSNKKEDKEKEKEREMKFENELKNINQSLKERKRGKEIEKEKEKEIDKEIIEREYASDAEEAPKSEIRRRGRALDRDRVKEKEVENENRESYFTLKKKDWKLLHDTAQLLFFFLIYFNFYYFIIIYSFLYIF